jgi:hypothetical protein
MLGPYCAKADTTVDCDSLRRSAPAYRHPAGLPPGTQVHKCGAAMRPEPPPPRPTPPVITPRAVGAVKGHMRQLTALMRDPRFAEEARAEFVALRRLLPPRVRTGGHVAATVGATAAVAPRWRWRRGSPRTREARSRQAPQPQPQGPRQPPLLVRSSSPILSRN